jgi:hypothetical protein
VAEEIEEEEEEEERGEARRAELRGGNVPAGTAWRVLCGLWG